MKCQKCTSNTNLKFILNKELEICMDKCSTGIYLFIINKLLSVLQLFRL